MSRFENILSHGSLPGADGDTNDNSTRGVLYASVADVCSIENVHSEKAALRSWQRVTVNNACLEMGSSYFLVQFDVAGPKATGLKWGSQGASGLRLIFRVKSSVPGDYVVAFRNHAQNRNYCAQYQIFKPGGWEFKDIIIPGDASGVWPTSPGAVGMFVAFVIGGGPEFNGRPNGWSDGPSFRTAPQVDLVRNQAATFEFGGITLSALADVSSEAVERSNGSRARAIRPGGKAVDAAYALERDFGMPLQLWNNFRAEVLAKVGAVVPAAAPRIVVAVDAGAPGSSTTIGRTLDSLDALSASIGAPVAVRIHSSGAPLDPDNWTALQSNRNALELYRSFGNCLERLAEADFLLFLKSGDEVSPEYGVALDRAVRSDADFVSSDLWFVEGANAYPLLAPGINSLHGLECDHFFSVFLASARAVQSVWANVRVPTPYALAREILNLAVAGNLPGKLVHVSLPLVQLQLTMAGLAAKRADLITRRARPAGLAPATLAPAVSVVILTKDKGHLLRQLVNRLERETLVKEIVVISNRTTNVYAMQALADIVSQKTRVISNNGGFNFSALCNQGARQTTGEYLLFLNDDIVPVGDRWLEELLAPHRLSDQVAISGSLLLYPNESVQHGGMYTGFNQCCGHTLRHAQLPGDDYTFFLSAPRWVSAVTGAAMLFKRHHFNRLNGFDEMLGSFLQDLDICLRARKSGFQIAFNPRSVLLHMESVSSSADINAGLENTRRGLEHQYFMERWADELYSDEFHPPAFDIGDEEMGRLALPKTDYRESKS